MDELLGVVASAMHSDLARLNTVAHNLANVSTIGFKRVMPNPGLGFEQSLQQADSLQQTPMVVDSRQGALSPTGSYFDMAIEGDAYFQVAGPNNQIWLSRGGAFALDSRGRLVAVQSGLPLLGEGGEIFLRAEPFHVDSTGRLTQNNQVLSRIKLVFPTAGAHIEPQGEGLYQLSRGTLEYEGKAQVRQGFQEASNVNSAKEMVTLIETTRHFESMQKVVHGVDALWEKALRSLGEF
jgi:flagellar basal body rod protein FlgG